MAGTPLLRRLAIGLGAHGVLQLVLLAIRVLEVPLFLGFWGAHRYGEWLMIAAIPASLTFADGGLAKTTSREMSIRSGRGDDQGMRRAFQTGWLMTLLICAVVMLLVLLLLAFIPIHQLLGLESTSKPDVSLVIVLWTLQVFLSFQSGLIYGALSSRGAYARATLLQSAGFLLSFVGLAIGVAKGGLVAAAGGSLIGAALGYVLLLCAFLASERTVEFGVKSATLAELKSIIKPSLASLAFPVGEALNIQGLRLVVGLLFGPAALAVFSATRTLCRVALQPILSIARTIEPEMSMAFGGRNHRREAALLVNGTGIAAWASMVLCVVLLLIGPFLFDAWTRHQLTFHWWLFVGLLAASLINAIWSVAAAVPMASNRHASLSVWFLCLYGGGAVVVTMMASYFFGAVSSAIGLVAAEAVFAYVAISIACGLVGLETRQWMINVVNPARISVLRGRVE